MSERFVQYALPLEMPDTSDALIEQPKVIMNNSNSISPEDRAVHDWYRFVLSYPPAQI